MNLPPNPIDTYYLVERGYIGIEPYSKRNDSIISQELVRKRCEVVIEEKATWFSKNMTIDKVIQDLKLGDKLIIASLVFLANDLSNLIRRVNKIEEQGATLVTLDMKDGLSNHLQAFKDFNAYVASSKIKAGQSRSKKQQGRKPALSGVAINLVKAQWKSGNFTISHLARTWKVSRRTIQRIVKIEEE
jgi:DNA invertase Pin-like site-specific DNA recombinase